MSGANSRGLYTPVPMMTCLSPCLGLERETYPSLMRSAPASIACSVHLASLFELFLSSVASTWAMAMAGVIGDGDGDGDGAGEGERAGEGAGDGERAGDGGVKVRMSVRVRVWVWVWVRARVTARVRVRVTARVRVRVTREETQRLRVRVIYGGHNHPELCIELPLALALR